MSGQQPPISSHPTEKPSVPTPKLPVPQPEGNQGFQKKVAAIAGGSGPAALDEESYSIVGIAPSGDCLFDAVVRALHDDGTAPAETIKGLRQRVVDFVNQHVDRLIDPQGFIGNIALGAMNAQREKGTPELSPQDAFAQIRESASTLGRWEDSAADYMPNLIAAAIGRNLEIYVEQASQIVPWMGGGQVSPNVVLPDLPEAAGEPIRLLFTSAEPGGTHLNHYNLVKPKAPAQQATPPQPTASKAPAPKVQTEQVGLTSPVGKPLVVVPKAPAPMQTSAAAIIAATAPRLPQPPGDIAGSGYCLTAADFQTFCQRHGMEFVKSATPPRADNCLAGFAVLPARDGHSTIVERLAVLQIDVAMPDGTTQPRYFIRGYGDRVVDLQAFGRELDTIKRTGKASDAASGQWRETATRKALSHLSEQSGLMIEKGWHDVPKGILHRVTLGAPSLDLIQYAGWGGDEFNLVGALGADSTPYSDFYFDHSGLENRLLLFKNSRKVPEGTSFQPRPRGVLSGEASEFLAGPIIAQLLGVQNIRVEGSPRLSPGIEGGVFRRLHSWFPGGGGVDADVTQGIPEGESLKLIVTCEDSSVHQITVTNKSITAKLLGLSQRHDGAKVFVGQEQHAGGDAEVDVYSYDGTDSGKHGTDDGKPPKQLFDSAGNRYDAGSVAKKWSWASEFATAGRAAFDAVTLAPDIRGGLGVATWIANTGSKALLTALMVSQFARLSSMIAGDPSADTATAADAAMGSCEDEGVSGFGAGPVTPEQVAGVITVIVVVQELITHAMNFLGHLVPDNVQDDDHVVIKHIAPALVHTVEEFVRLSANWGLQVAFGLPRSDFGDEAPALVMQSAVKGIVIDPYVKHSGSGALPVLTGQLATFANDLLFRALGNVEGCPEGATPELYREALLSRFVTRGPDKLLAPVAGDLLDRLGVTGSRTDALTARPGEGTGPLQQPVGTSVDLVNQFVASIDDRFEAISQTVLDRCRRAPEGSFDVTLLTKLYNGVNSARAFVRDELAAAVKCWRDGHVQPHPGDTQLVLEAPGQGALPRYDRNRSKQTAQWHAYDHHATGVNANFDRMIEDAQSRYTADPPAKPQDRPHTLQSLPGPIRRGIEELHSLQKPQIIEINGHEEQAKTRGPDRDLQRPPEFVTVRAQNFRTYPRAVYESPGVKTGHMPISKTTFSRDIEDAARPIHIELVRHATLFGTDLDQADLGGLKDELLRAVHLYMVESGNFHFPLRYSHTGQPRVIEPVPGIPVQYAAMHRSGTQGDKLVDPLDALKVSLAMLHGSKLPGIYTRGVLTLAPYSAQPLDPGVGPDGAVRAGDTVMFTEITSMAASSEAAAAFAATIDNCQVSRERRNLMVLLSQTAVATADKSELVQSELISSPGAVYEVVYVDPGRAPDQPAGSAAGEADPSIGQTVYLRQRDTYEWEQNWYRYQDKDPSLKLGAIMLDPTTGRVFEKTATGAERSTHLKNYFLGRPVEKEGSEPDRERLLNPCNAPGKVKVVLDAIHAAILRNDGFVPFLDQATLDPHHEHFRIKGGYYDDRNVHWQRARAEMESTRAQANELARRLEAHPLNDAFTDDSATLEPLIVWLASNYVRRTVQLYPVDADGNVGQTPAMDTHMGFDGRDLNESTDPSRPHPAIAIGYGPQGYYKLEWSEGHAAPTAIPIRATLEGNTAADLLHAIFAAGFADARAYNRSGSTQPALRPGGEATKTVSALWEKMVAFSKVPYLVFQRAFVEQGLAAELLDPITISIGSEQSAGPSLTSQPPVSPDQAVIEMVAPQAQQPGPTAEGLEQQEPTLLDQIRTQAERRRGVGRAVRSLGHLARSLEGRTRDPDPMAQSSGTASEEVAAVLALAATQAARGDRSPPTDKG